MLFSAHSARLALAVLSCLLLSSCFSESSGSGDEAADTGGQRISLAMLLPPRSGLSPYSDDAFKLSRWSVTETLVVLNEDGDPLPGLAESFEQVDAMTWRFVLRDRVTFHDGTDLTVERVVDSLRRATSAAPQPRILDAVELTIEPDGEEAVLVTTADPDPLLPNRLSSPQLPILAARAYTDAGPVDPVRAGTGPFVLTAVNGSSGATVDRYDDYWGEPAKASGIDVSYVPDGTARAAALRTGEADVVEAVPTSQVSLLDPETVTAVQLPRTNTLYLNTATGPFAEPAVRAAVREAIDRSPLVDGVYEGRADLAEGLLGPALPWTSDRPDRAGSARPASPPAEPITLATFSDRPELPEVASVLEQQLEAAGFVVEQEVREYSQIEADALAGAFDAFILSRATVLDSGDPVAYLTSDFTCDGGFNLSQLCAPQVDAAVSRAAGVPAGEQRRQAILAAEAVVLGTDAAIPLLHERVIQGVAPGVEAVAYDPRERLLITADTRKTRR